MGFEMAELLECASPLALCRALTSFGDVHTSGCIEGKAAEAAAVQNLAEVRMGFEVAELLECASPLALWEGAHMAWRCAHVRAHRRESGRGLPQSKT